MDVSSQSIVLPTPHRRRYLTTTHTPIFIDTSPIAVSNKIKAIKARKTRLNPIPTNSGYTDIRPLNFGYNGGVSHSNSNSNVTVWTAERLVDRSKGIRLDRISTRQPPRPSALSATSTNQQSLLWANYQPSTVGNKQLQTNSNTRTITPTAIESIKNKSPGGKMPEIVRRRNRQPLIDRQNSLTPVELQAKSFQSPIFNFPERTTNNNLLGCETEEEEEEREVEEEDNVVMDKEFEQYFERAIVKCADWLMKYVFNEKND